MVIMVNCGSNISCNSPPPEHNYVCCFVCFLYFFGVGWLFLEHGVLIMIELWLIY